MADYHLSIVRQALQRPYGMVLVTGPTGSGKTTTLYSMLRELDREKKNVLSLEDPVEYLVDGVSQSQVRPEIGYTFANGLRSILRQDPDIIFVGEIRDKETAELAVQAALTGHLVFSTLHTNSAIGVIPRLVDMGVDPYLIAPTLNLAIGQRLLKRICTGAEKELQTDESVQLMIDDQFSDLPEQYRSQYDLQRRLYEAGTSASCPSGVRGRVAVYEMFTVNSEVESMILKNPTEEALYKVARKYGMLTMKDDAVLKSMNGTIPFHEVNSL
jgi:type IV pilus assembly protein PilB